MVPPMMKALLLAVVMGLLAPAAAVYKFSLYGYFLTSDVSPQLALSPQQCAIRVEFLKGNTTGAMALYRAPGAYGEFVSNTKYSNGPMNQMLFNSGLPNTYTGPADIHNVLEKAVNSGIYIHLLISTLYHVRGKILFDYLDEAIMGTGAFDAVQGLDRAWAILSGDPVVHKVDDSNPKTCPDSMHSIFELTPASLSYHGLSEANLLNALWFNTAKAEAFAAFADPSSKGVKDNLMQVARIYGEFGLTYLRHGSYSVSLGQVCNNTIVTTVAKSNNVLIWPMVKAIVKGFNATDASLAALDTLIYSGAGFIDISNAIQNVISTTPIKMGDLGVPIRDYVVYGWSVNGPDFFMFTCTAPVPTGVPCH